MELVSLPIMDAHEGAAMAKAATQTKARRRITGVLRILEIFNIGLPFQALLKRFVF
jgi:hypothetical protein